MIVAASTPAPEKTVARPGGAEVACLSMAPAMTQDIPFDEVLERFGLPLSAGWRVEHLRTMNNSVFGVGRDGEPHRWVLRRHRAGWRDVDAISAELEVLTYLDRELPDRIVVPRPGRGRVGEKLITVAGSHYSLLRWVSGSVRRPNSGLDEASAVLLGYGLGSIHAATDRSDELRAPIEWNATTLFDRHPGLLGADPAELESILAPDEFETFQEVAGRTADAFERQQDRGIIHADYILGNCHWTTEAGRLQLGVLDFDDFGYGWRLFDLGAVLGNLADFTDSWPILARAFLAGYRSAHELPDDAVPDLPVMMAARHASHCLWAIGHRDQGRDWIVDHARARIELARACLSVSL
jgi:Ser/Thr protein kinase RdoA (MazF antagonist)